MSAVQASSNSAQRFLEWRTKHQRAYPTPEAEDYARKDFLVIDEFVMSFPFDRTWTVMHNSFSDNRPSSRIFGLKSSLGRNLSVSLYLDIEEEANAIPDSIDWVDKGAVGQVQEQGRCGSCWAFSATAAIEAAMFIAGGGLHALSVEELVQCDSSSHGCTGGSQATAFTFARDRGLVPEAVYPYTSVDGSTGECDHVREAGDAIAKITGYRLLPPSSDSIRVALALVGPVSAAMFADWLGFQQYASGIISAEHAKDDCSGKSINHGVLIVGYGVDQRTGLRYWKVM